MVNITLSESILGSLDREDNHGGWEFVFSAPFKFGILIILIAVRIKRYFWRPKRRLVDADWICLTKPTLFDKAQGFTASLLLVHAVAGLTGLSPNSSQDKVQDS